jgi:hypothetical protein
MRLLVSPELSTWIVERITAFSTERPEQYGWLERFVNEFGALPLHVEWFDVIALCPDGEIVKWSTEGEYIDTQPVEDRYYWLTSLVDATKRYPELKELLPLRPLGAQDCWHLPYPIFAEGKVFCPDCCGLGWKENGSVNRDSME